MSSKIKVDTIENVAGSGNVSLGSGHNLVVPGDLTVDTNTLKVDSSNNRVGVGVTSPAAPFHINLGTDKNLQFSGGIGEIGSVPGFQATNDAGTALSDFGIRANANMRFAIASNERFRITANGVTFNGDTAAANALSDYEEGTYDVTMTCGSSGTITVRSDYNTGGYIKVGNLVTVYGYVVVSAISSPNGYIEFNLPFAVTNTSEGHASSAIYTHIGGLSGKNTNEIGNGLAFNGSSVFRVYSTDSTAYGVASANSLTSSSFVYFGGSYRTG